MKARSIASRMTGWYVFCLFILILFATVFLYLSLAKALRREDLSTIEDRLQTVVSLLQRPVDPIAFLKHRIESEWPSRKTAVFVRILGEDGKTLVETPGISPEMTHSIFEQKILSDPARFEAPTGHAYLTSEVSFPDPISGASIIRIAVDITEEDRLLAGYRNRLVAVLLISLLISAVLGRKLARARFLRSRIHDQL